MNEAINSLAEKESAASAGCALLPLDAPERIVVFRSGQRSYRHVFRRICAADWEKFFSAVVAEFRNESGGYSQLLDTDCASLKLYSLAIQRVEGYRTRDGVAVESLTDWKARIPQNHQLTAVDLLMKVGPTEHADESLLESEGVTILLDALWNEGDDGAMRQYRGLAHRFASPTAEHRRRFLRARNRAFVAGGSRAGTTIIPSAHPVLAKLYDELVLSVEGYSAAGAALTSREQIAREMDSVHKAAAVGELFPTALPRDEIQKESEAA